MSRREIARLETLAAEAYGAAAALSVDRAKSDSSNRAGWLVQVWDARGEEVLRSVGPSKPLAMSLAKEMLQRLVTRSREPSDAGLGGAP